MKISSKISLLGAVAVIVVSAALIVVVLFQKETLRNDVTTILRAQAEDEAVMMAHSVYAACLSSEARTSRRLDYNLFVARTQVQEAGGIALGTETVEWKAVNQFTRQAETISLPKVLLGSQWMGQVSATNARVPVVDDVKRFTRDSCTVFQRMNDAGDMLRIATSVVATNGARSVGTYIPARNPDGVENAVISTVLKGQTYSGRAYVVDDWYLCAYEPVWNAGKTKVIGMLFVGVGMKDIVRDVRQIVMTSKLGKSGYVYVLGGKGDQKGKYIISKDGQRDGESIWDARDASGRLPIQSIVEKALQTKNNEKVIERYPWKNKDETEPREKFVAVNYFEAWDWVIGASGYYDDFQEATSATTRALNRLVAWVAGTSIIAVILAFLISHLVSRDITRPIVVITEKLSSGADHTNAVASQLATASQSLAEGANNQASALQETSSSLETMATMIQRNTENADKVNELARAARTAADAGSRDMEGMSVAMKDIRTSSDEIAKIIKTIDEIAFQTNILALNAAVEAARAGESGLGFAVVAEEVRNLAQRSAQAARETAEKIETAVSKSILGVQISDKVAASLTEIVSKSRQVNELAAEVASASKEQSEGIQQVNAAVAQVDKVTQTNAAGAEETASAAGELNTQAAELNKAVTALLRLVKGG